MRWKEALTELASGMELATDEEVSSTYQMFFRLGQRVQHLPYARLRRAQAHRWGCLRVWPKGKSFTAGLPGWNAIKWRPLVAYHRHHWARVLSIAGKACSYATVELNIGWGTTNPGEAGEASLKSNGGERASEKRWMRRRLSVAVRDIK